MINDGKSSDVGMLRVMHQLRIVYVVTANCLNKRTELNHLSIEQICVCFKVEFVFNLVLFIYFHDLQAGVFILAYHFPHIFGVYF